jgi:pimeloyl-ACP methyl ester carboxylesterase
MRRFWLRVLVTGVVLGMAGCDEEEAASTEPSASTAVATPSLREPEGAPASSAAPEEVVLTTSDGVPIHATLRRGGTLDAPAVVLVHQLGSARAEWAPVVAALAEAPGMTTLAIDLRGHGESTVGPDGTELSQHAFETEDWLGIELDVRAALDFLEGHEALHPRSIGVAGSSIGSTAVLAAAAGDERVRAVVAISPGRAYHGFDAMTPASRLGNRPLLLIGAEDETPVAETLDAMAAMNPRAERMVVSGAAHGLSMQAEEPQMIPRIATFLRASL